MYGSLYFGLPETNKGLLWIAVYNKSSYSLDKVKPLKGRFVYVFPDLSSNGNTYQEWYSKSRQFEVELKGTKFIVSDFLEQCSSIEDKINGLDLADYLIKHDWRQFRNQPVSGNETSNSVLITPSESVESVESVVQKTIYNSCNPTGNRKTYTPPPIQFTKFEDWSREIDTIENFLLNTPDFNTPICIGEGVTITDLNLFFTGHLTMVRCNNGIKAYKPYLNRLMNVYTQLTTNKIENSLII